jgi:hypothetical protein
MTIVEDAGQALVLDSGLLSLLATRAGRRVEQLVKAQQPH